MKPSIELFIVTSCLITVLISIWIANLMTANSLARIISMRVAKKFNLIQKELELICIDKRNKFLINLGVILLIIVGGYSYVEYGVFYTLMLPVISLLSIVISQSFVHTNIYSKNRVDELLEYLLVKENNYKKISNPQLDKIQKLCSFLIDEFKNESILEDEAVNRQKNIEVEGFEKSKHHISNIGSEINLGLKILLILFLGALLAVGVREYMKEPSRKRMNETIEKLEDMRKLVEENKKAN
jgi:hypothetical protein